MSDMVNAGRAQQAGQTAKQEALATAEMRQRHALAERAATTPRAQVAAAIALLLALAASARARSRRARSAQGAYGRVYGGAAR